MVDDGGLRSSIAGRDTAGIEPRRAEDEPPTAAELDGRSQCSARPLELTDTSRAPITSSRPPATRGRAPNAHVSDARSPARQHRIHPTQTKEAHREPRDHRQGQRLDVPQAGVAPPVRRRPEAADDGRRRARAQRPDVGRRERPVHHPAAAARGRQGLPARRHARRRRRRVGGARPPRDRARRHARRARRLDRTRHADHQPRGLCVDGGAARRDPLRGAVLDPRRPAGVPAVRVPGLDHGRRRHGPAVPVRAAGPQRPRRDADDGHQRPRAVREHRPDGDRRGARARRDLPRAPHRRRLAAARGGARGARAERRLRRAVPALRRPARDAADQRGGAQEGAGRALPGGVAQRPGGQERRAPARGS